MKRITGIILIILLLAGGYAAWNIFGPVVSAPEGKYFYIKTGSSFDDVKKTLKDQGILSGTFFFDKVSAQAKYKARVKPGRYEIKDNSSLVSLVRMLKRGTQTPVRLVINKLRTKDDLAAKVSRNFECDSLEVIQFLTSNDSLAPYGLDTNIVMTAVIPDTYLILWNSPFKKIFGKLKSESETFWNNKRLQKAASKKLSQTEVYIMAAIVEEETNKATDKGLIASVYRNRISRGQRLEADPTVKYAMRNFGLKRVLRGHLKYPSPYNTYLHTGLPPGPICTASPETIDAVLDSPETDYMFFVAKPDFNGYSNFAATYAEHLVFARAYQHALDSVIISRQAGTNSTP